MKNIKFLVSLFILLTLSSCSTIHYRFEGEPNGNGQREWHHIGVFQLVEFSDPVRVKRACPKGVHKITSKRNALQAIISAFPWVGWVWSPTEVSMECSDGLMAKNTSGAGSNQNTNTNTNTDTNNNNNNTNTININISPELLKKKKN